VYNNFNRLARQFGPLRPALTLLAPLLSPMLALVPTLAADAPRFKPFTPTYTLTDLGLLPGYTRGEALAINNRGDVIGDTISDLGKPNHAFLYDRGQLIDLVPSAGNTEPNAINARSQVVGFFYGQDGNTTTSFFYDRGTVVGLSVPGSTSTAAFGINNIDQIVGSYTTGPLGNQISYAFLRQPNGRFINLGSFGENTVAFKINNRGQILAGFFDGQHGHTLLMQPGGTAFKDLSSLSPTKDTDAGDLNELGEVVGATIAADGTQHAFLYSNGSMKDLGALAGGDQTWAQGINNLEQVVGGAYKPAQYTYGPDGQVIESTPPENYGWVYIQGQIYNLNKIMSADAKQKGWTISVAHGINDLGRIVGMASVNGGYVHAVILTPNAILHGASTIP
jgi:probable HAF family extracellular repeat protein